MTPTKPRRTSSAAVLASASYEEAAAELDALLAALEAGQLPLDQLLARYQRGAELLAFCRSRLAAVEGQVKVLEDGQMAPWNEAAEAAT